MKNEFPALNLFLCLFLYSCIDPINIEIPAAASRLVVDGIIDNTLKRQEVKLSRTTDYREDFISNLPEREAKLKITDDLGNEWVLTENQPGIYFSTMMQGIIGRSYTLHIQTSDGNQYRSVPEKIKAVSPVDSIYAEYIEFPLIITNSAGIKTQVINNGFAVYALTRDQISPNDFYRWRSEGIFQFNTICKCENPPWPTICWAPVNPINEKIYILWDKNTNGQLIRQQVATLPYDQATPYFVNVRQYSLSENSYRFWKLISEQQGNVGTIFDPPPAQIIGNIFNTEDETELVAGFFGASAVESKTIIIRRGLLANGKPPLRPVLPEGDCRLLYRFSTSVRPPQF